MNKLKSNLHALLQKEKISESELARRTGVKQQIINRILSGENQNPKLSTLNPLTNYFKISISQLIGDAPLAQNPHHLNLHEIPILESGLLVKEELRTLLKEAKEMLIVDESVQGKDIFAIRLVGNAMEPQFPEGSLLFFDPHRVPKSGDYVLLKTTNHTIEVRQYVLKEDKPHKKSLNPTDKDYQATPLNEVIPIGLLIQSRIIHKV